MIYFIQKVCLATLLLCCHQTLSAQNAASGDLVAIIADFIDHIPGDSGDDYTSPTSVELMNWENCLIHLLQKNYSTAALLADQIAYEIIQFKDTGNNQTYFILQRQNSGNNHWGTYVFNPNPCQSNLVIQAPHPRNDSNTGDQGIYILRDIGALFFMVAGTHRCNSDSYSTCSGTTSTCDNGTESYRSSDMAHIDNSIFHKTTELLLEKLIDPFFIQLHGFSKKTEDPYLILSNGTTLPPLIDYLSRLGDALVSIDPTLDFKVAHINTNIRLKGTTNTQGRLINGSNTPCTVSAAANSGRFLHIEQEKSKLRADANGWQKMADALEIVFRNLSLGTNNLFLTDYDTLDTLSSANIISNGTSVNFEAGKLIKLETGFHAVPGSNLLAQISGCQSASPLSPISPPTVKRSSHHTIHANFTIMPNPFRHSVLITLDLPKSEIVTLAIYNATGILLKRLEKHNLCAKGNYQYLLEKNDFPEGGMYFIQLATTNNSITKKLVLMK